VDNLYALPVLLPYIREKYGDDPLVVVSPDAGGVERARAYAKRLSCGLAVADKRRPQPNQAEITYIIGDVKNKTAIVVDDMVDTGGTVAKVSEGLKENGARKVVVVATHGVFSGSSFQLLSSAPIEELIVTDTIPLKGPFLEWKKLTVRTVSELLGEAILRISHESSVSSLFM
jgi:ribose-phosphate pyrophosphokinase